MHVKQTLPRFELNDDVLPDKMMCDASFTKKKKICDAFAYIYVGL